MKTKLFRGVAIVLAMIMCMAVGAFAAVNLQEIKAYLNYDLAIRYDGKLQTMYDANGNQVLPISYNGTTYLPIRAVGNMMGIDVDYDAENYQVLLGKTGRAIDFVETLTPYSSTGNYRHYREADNKPITLGTKTYSNYIYIHNDDQRGFYDLAGKYDTLTFSVYSEDNEVIKVYGDNDQLLANIEIKASALPQKYSVKVTGVQQLCIEQTNIPKMISYSVKLFDVTIE